MLNDIGKMDRNATLIMASIVMPSLVYAEDHNFYIVMLSFFMLSAIMPSVVVPSVILLNAILLSVILMS